MGSRVVLKPGRKMLESMIADLEDYIAAKESGHCCSNCQRGTDDCDVNPLVVNRTLEEARKDLSDLREMLNG